VVFTLKTCKYAVKICWSWKNGNTYDAAYLQSSLWNFRSCKSVSLSV